jgi:hypothetical protein
MPALLRHPILLFVSAMACAACSTSSGGLGFDAAGLDIPSSCTGAFDPCPGGADDRYIVFTGNQCGCMGTYYLMCVDGSFSECVCSLPSGEGCPYSPGDATSEAGPDSSDAATDAPGDGSIDARIDSGVTDARDEG